MSDDGTGCGPRRIARPCRYMPSSEEHSEACSGLLSKIDSHYAEARDRLAVRARPATLSRFLDAGFCIGLLDPVSNIMINSICTSDRHPDPREKVLAGGVVEDQLPEMGRSSFKGLIAFLLYLFPYLANWEALRYLLLADADLLAAARLIVADRGMLMRFSLNSAASAPALEAALKVAAQVSKHPQPNGLVHAWMLLSSRPLQALGLLSEVNSHSPLQDLERLKAMLDDPVVPNLAFYWDLAARRTPHDSILPTMPYEHTRSLRMVLLDTIHGFYLQALARLPRRELRSHLHRSLLMAGYCYGPLDPVSNIIYNTIWYHANFPAEATPVLDLIGPDSLTRLETRSFYGLVSFILTRYHHLSEHQAVQCLVAACGQLSLADPKLIVSSAAELAMAEQHHRQHRSVYRRLCSHYDEVIRNVEEQSPSAGVQEAYMAAATAAWHPNPDEQATFLASWKGSPVMNQLTSDDVHRWAQCMSPEQPPTPERLCTSGTGYDVRDGKTRCVNQQRRVSRKVKAALRKHLLQDGKPAYDLHIISCVNEHVGPDYCEETIDPLNVYPYSYRYAHVNFLATPKGSLSSASYPILFFAEFDNEKEDTAPLLCCPVHEPIPFTEHVRCLYCEAEGARVVHPTSMEFHGSEEFEKVIRGEHSLTNAWLISKNHFAVHRMRAIEEDFMYVDVN